MVRILLCINSEHIFNGFLGGGSFVASYLPIHAYPEQNEVKGQEDILS